MTAFIDRLKAKLNNGTTFANVHYVTDVKTAAKFKSHAVKKHTTANVQLFNNVTSDVYSNQVIRSASKLGNPITEFEKGNASFAHDDGCYSIVRNGDKEYLYCIFNNATSYYTIDGKLASKEQVMGMLTPSAKKAAESKTVYNKANDVTHNVIVRTIKLSNVIGITVGGETLVV